jgi:hypothetical protein
VSKTTAKKAAKAVKAVKAKKKVAPKAAKAKTTKQAAPAASSMKKLSPELQIIKGFYMMHGKTYKASSLLARQKKLLKQQELGFLNHHTALIAEIRGKYKTIAEQIASKNPETVDISINQDFLQKCKDAVASAKVKLRVEYLGGVKKKR